MGGIKRKGGKSGELRRLISDARLASDQSVVKIAKKAGLSANYIRLIESGERRPSQDALSRICQALELSADQWRSFFKAAALEPPTNERSGWLGDALRLTSHLKPTALELMASAKYWGIRIPAERTFEKAAEKIQDEGYTTIAPSAIEVMVERIDANGWVEHRVWDDVETGLPARNGQLEAKLLERFNLRHAIVGTLPQFVRTSSEHDDDDLLHHWLGRMAAPALIVTLREGDVIAFGSGRGPFQCAKAVSVRSAQSFPQVKRIAPLCGVIDARDWAGGRPDRMDADDVVRVFRGIVLDREPAPLINAPVLNMVPRRMPAHLQIEEWQRDPAMVPDVAVVGVGGLAGHHRLLWEDESLGTPSEEFVQELKHTVKAIDEAVKQQSKRQNQVEYHCVADLCNHLIAVEPPQEVDVKLWKKLERLISEFNKRAIVPDVRHFSMMAKKGAVIAVAGGVYKRYAIRKVLTMSSRPIITILVTDDATAAWLCESQE